MSDAQNLDPEPVDLDPEPVTASEGQPVDVPLNEPTEDASGAWGGKVADPDDGIQDFDDEDSEEVEATLPEDSYSEAEAEPDGEGPQ